MTSDPAQRERSQVVGGGDGAAVAAAASAAATTVSAAPSVEPVAGVRGGRFSIRTFDSLRDPLFRWFFLAMLGQNAAMNMQWLVRGWLVFDLTGSYAALGVMSLANGIPGAALSPFGGVLADRLPKKYLIQTGQALNAVLALAVAVLLYAGLLRFEHLLISAVLQGAVNALMMPSRQAMVPEVVGMERLMNAVALNTAGMNVMRLMAPGLGGLLIAGVGAGAVYSLMAALYFVAMVTLSRVPMTSTPAGTAEVAGSGASAPRRAGDGGLRDGLRYIAGHPTLLMLLTMNFFFVLLSMPYTRVLAGFVTDVLDGGPGELGLLMSITGIGSLAGSLWIASLPNRNRGKLMLLSALVLGVALLAFSASTWFWVTAGLMIVLGLGQSGRMSLSNVLLQSYVDNEYRGRVMSIYTMERSWVSLSAFALGVVASLVGVQVAIGSMAVAMIALTLGAMVFVPRLRKLD